MKLLVYSVVPIVSFFPAKQIELGCIFQCVQRKKIYINISLVIVFLTRSFVRRFVVQINFCTFPNYGRLHEPFSFAFFPSFGVHRRVAFTFAGLGVVIYT